MEHFGDGSQNYEDRQSIGINIGEKLFEDWTKEKCTFIARLGFDEKYGNVPNFFDLNPIVRNIPDYVILNNNRLFLVNVKGTTNIKAKEIAILPQLVEAYSSEKAPLVYAFCFRGEIPQFITTTQLNELYELGVDKEWTDGIKYRRINLSQLYK